MKRMLFVFFLAIIVAFSVGTVANAQPATTPTALDVPAKAEIDPEILSRITKKIWKGEAGSPTSGRRSDYVELQIIDGSKARYYFSEGGTKEGGKTWKVECFPVAGHTFAIKFSGSSKVFIFDLKKDQSGNDVLHGYSETAYRYKFYLY